MRELRDVIRVIPKLLIQAPIDQIPSVSRSKSLKTAFETKEAPHHQVYRAPFLDQNEVLMERFRYLR